MSNRIADFWEAWENGIVEPEHCDDSLADIPDDDAEGDDLEDE